MLRFFASVALLAAVASGSDPAGVVPPTISTARDAALKAGRSLWVADDGATVRDDKHTYRAEHDGYVLEHGPHDARAVAESHKTGMKLLDLDNLRLEWAKQLFRRGGRARGWLYHMTPHQQKVFRARALGMITKQVTALPDETLTDHGLRIAAKKCHDAVLPVLEKFYLRARHENEYKEYLKSIPDGAAAKKDALRASQPDASDAIGGADGVMDPAKLRAAQIKAVLSDPMLPHGFGKADIAKALAARATAIQADPALEGTTAISGDASVTSSSSSSSKNVYDEDDVRSRGHAAVRTAHRYRRALSHAARWQKHADDMQAAAYGPYGRQYLKSYKKALRRWKHQTRAVRKLRKQFVRSYNRFVEGVKSKRSGSKAYRAALVQLTAAISSALGVPPKHARF